MAGTAGVASLQMSPAPAFFRQNRLGAYGDGRGGVYR